MNLDTSEQENSNRIADEGSNKAPSEKYFLAEDEKEEPNAIFDPNRNTPISTRKMLTMFLKIAVPAVVTNIIGITTMIVNTFFAGHMDDPINLAAVGLSNTCCIMFVLSLLIGLNVAQETLTSQAYGADSNHLCGIYLNRGRVIMTVFYAFFAFWPMVFGEEILNAIGIDEDVARLTQT